MLFYLKLCIHVFVYHMMILLLVISKIIFVSFNSKTMLPLWEQELLTLPDQSPSDSVFTNWSMLVTNGLFCCLIGCSKSIIHMLSKDVLILEWLCNSRTTTARFGMYSVCGVIHSVGVGWYEYYTCVVVKSKLSLRQFYDRRHDFVTSCVTNNHGNIFLCS